MASHRSHRFLVAVILLGLLCHLVLAVYHQHIELTQEEHTSHVTQEEHTTHVKQEEHTTHVKQEEPEKEDRLIRDLVKKIAEQQVR